MDLKISPYTYISTPKFGETAQNEKIEAVWEAWRTAVRDVLATFRTIVDALPPKSSMRYVADKDLLIGILTTPPEQIRKSIYESFQRSIKADDSTLIEAARRARLFLTGDTRINQHGRTDWEQEIHDATGDGKRKKLELPRPTDGGMFSLAEKAEMARLVDSQAAEIAELRAKLGVAG